MALAASGTLSIGGTTANRSINLELSRSGTATSSLGETDLRTLAGVSSGAISISNFYGASSFATTHVITQGNYNNSYYGKFATLAGSVSPTTFSGFTVDWFMRNSTTLMMRFSGSNQPTNVFTTVKINAGGTIITLPVSAANIGGTSSGRTYSFTSADFTAAESTAFVSTFDGSGNIDIILDGGSSGGGGGSATTVTVTQANYNNSYYGKFISGSTSPTAVNGYTIKYAFKTGTAASPSFWIYLTGSVPTTAFTSVKLNFSNGTSKTLTASSATTSQEGYLHRYWSWSSSAFTTAEKSNLAATWDGSGNITMEVT